jgi:hypothetical protein
MSGFVTKRTNRAGLAIGEHIGLCFAAGRGRSSLRRTDFNPMNFHLLADTLQVLVVARRRASLDDVTDTGRLHYRFCQANFVDAGETLHAGGDIHILPEVIDPVVEPYGNGPASVHTDFKAERP